MYKELDKSKMYDNSLMSFMFEFRSPVRRRDMSSKFSKNLGKKMKWFKGVDESFKPTHDIFKLSNKYSEDSKYFVFETGFMTYHEANHMMLKAMNIIDNFGFTDDRCEAKIKISVNERDFNKINKFKYIIGFDEASILENWNTKLTERHKLENCGSFSIYAKDPYNTIISTSAIERMDQNTFNFPESEFFGIDFSHINEKYITINYIGGVDYQKRKREAINTINSVIERIYETLENNYSYDVNEKRKIEKMVEKYGDIVKKTKTYSQFQMNYPNIELFFDLSKNQYLLESNYHHFRQKIFELVVYGEIEKGQINWDNAKKKIQIRESRINKNLKLEDFEFYDCIVESDTENCLFHDCSIKNSKLVNCEILSNNYIKNSKVLECKYQGTDNEIVNSYIDNNPKNMIDANVKNCLVNKGTFRMNSKVDKQTIILNK